MYPWKALVCNITTQVVQSEMNGVGTVGPAKDQLLSHFNKQDQSFNVESIFPVYSKFANCLLLVAFCQSLFADSISPLPSFFGAPLVSVCKSFFNSVWLYRHELCVNMQR